MDETNFIFIRLQCVTLRVEIDLNGELMKVLGLFKYLGSCFNKDGSLQEDVYVIRRTDNVFHDGLFKLQLYLIEHWSNLYKSQLVHEHRCCN